MNIGVDSMQVFKCMKCGKMVMMMKNSSCDTFCCGEEMVELKANTTDGAVEKHVPFVEIDEKTIKVSVGEVAHPMLEEHYIEWIALETNKGVHIVNLKAGEEPVAYYHLENEEAVCAYAYCNLHGLWKKDI